MKCPKCHSEILVRYGRACGRQRYRCKACGFQFTSENVRARSIEEKLFALTLFTSGLYMHADARILGVSVQTVSRWKKLYPVHSDKVVKAIRVRRVSSSGKVSVIRNNRMLPDEADDFKYGDVYSLETRLPSGIRVDLVVKRTAKKH